MKIEEINKLRIGDLVNVHYTSDTNSIVKIGHLLVDKIEHYPSGGVRIIKAGDRTFKWWEVVNIFKPEDYPEYFL